MKGKPLEDSLLDNCREALRLAEDPIITNPHPFEEAGRPDRRFREAIGMWDHVHTDHSPHQMKEVGHCPQLLFHTVQLGAGFGPLFGEELGVQVPGSDSVQALDYTGFPYRKQMNRIDHTGECQCVFDHPGVVANCAHVDADHVGSTHPCGILVANQRRLHLSGKVRG